MATERKAYWENRMEQLYKAQDKRNAKLDKKLVKEYKSIESELEKEIANYYQRFGLDQVIEYRKLVVSLSEEERNLLYKDYDSFMQRNPKYAHLMPVRESIYKLNRLEGLHLNIRMQIVELGAFEQEGFDKLLKDSYEFGYLSTMKGLANAQSFFSVNDVMLQQTLNKKWINGENYSDRIWGNKEKLINILTNEIRDAMIRGDSYQKMIKMLQHRLGVGAYDSRRLIATESAFVMNQANGQAFIDEGIKRYQNTGVLDSMTSPVCRNMDGQIFYFSEAVVGINFPPYHSWCRTTIVPIENEKRR